MLKRVAIAMAGAGVSVAMISPSASAQVSGTSGIDALVARPGAANAPTGTGVVVGQDEANESPGNYGPNQGNGEFVGKTFTAQSGAPGNSSHATTVGQHFYGLSSGMAPGITTIYLYEAGSWLQAAQMRSGAGTGTGNNPLVPPGGIKIFNNSWVGSF